MPYLVEVVENPFHQNERVRNVVLTSDPRVEKLGNVKLWMHG